MNKRLQALLQRKAAAVEKMKTIRAAAGEDIFTEDQTRDFEAAKSEAAQLGAAITQEQEAIEAERTLAIPGDARVENLGPNVQHDPRRGFGHFGEFLGAVRGASLRPAAVDERLLIGAAATTYANEGTGADGGFLVPTTYATEILSVIEGTDSLLSRVRQIPISGSELKIPANETSAHATTGIQAYWDAEASTMTATKPAFTNRSIKVDRLTALCPVTEEALEDSTALGSWVQMEAAEKMTFKVNDAILNGIGVGQPLGILNAPGTVSVAKEASQVAATIVAENVLKMKTRLLSASWARAVWIAHSDCEAQLAQMNFKIKNVAGTENVGGLPVFYPPNGMSSEPYGTLLGRPVIYVESCAALGTVGDFYLADFSKYIAVTKGGVKSDQSMHFYFDQNVRAFRFVMRIGGQPWLSAAVARKNGSSTQGHFVSLATRS